MKKSSHKENDYCCDMRGMLSFLILFLLAKKSMHGQALAFELEQRKGVRPSPGTLYPALKSLKQEGLINEIQIGRNINLAITSKGRNVLHVAKLKFCRIFKDVI